MGRLAFAGLALECLPTVAIWCVRYGIVKFESLTRGGFFSRTQFLVFYLVMGLKFMVQNCLEGLCVGSGRWGVVTIEPAQGSRTVTAPRLISLGTKSHAFILRTVSKIQMG